MFFAHSARGAESNDRQHAAVVFVRGVSADGAARWPGGLEYKFNPNHDPENGRFTFAGAGSQALGDTPSSKHAPKSRDERDVEHPSFRQVDLTTEEYNQKAKELWNTMEAKRDSGFKSDADVNAAVKRVADAPAQSTRDVEAPEDLRAAVLSVSRATSRASLRGGRSAEKTITFERRPDGQIVVASMLLPGEQGGGVPSIRSRTVGVAHVHYHGLELGPGRADHSAVKFSSIPSFVIVEDTGVVWEVGRQGGAYVQRQLRAKGKVGPWLPFKP